MTALPPRVRLTAAEFYALAERGVFASARFELINGEIVPMSSQSNWHASVIEGASRALRAVFPESAYWVRVQNSLDLDPHSVVDPDIAVIPGHFLDPVNAERENPTAALLIVEVCETTLYQDRRRKGSLYAAAGIADYWILNIVHKQLEVYRDPVPDEETEFKFRYASLTELDVDAVVSPLAAPAAVVAVADLMPIYRRETP